MGAKAGDRIRVKMEKEEIEGVLMPSLRGDVLMVKLDNGYNMGIKKRKVKEIKIIKKYKEKKGIKKIKQKKELPEIAILHCGGTIASKVDYETGAVKAKFKPEELLELFPELGKIVRIRSRLVGNMFSEDLRWEHFNLMAKEVEKAVRQGVEGVIVTHGTDFLHYTAAALAFALENLSVPVLLVAAQRSSDRGSSDAGFNLLGAARFIVNSDFGEVGICMHKGMEDKKCVILPGCKSRKLHTSRRDAFKAVNTEAWAYVDTKGEIEYVRRSYRKKDLRGKLNLRLFKEGLKVGMIKAHPAMGAEEIKNYSGYEGVVLEGGGIAGNFPINVIDKYTKEHARIYEEIKKLARKMPVVGTSQCIFGRVNMNVYSTGRKLKEAGVLGDLLDMTAETAFIKLGWLLSNEPKKVKELMGKNLRGEISERIEGKGDFMG